MSAPNDVKEVVREKYSQAALRVTAGQSGCCTSAPRTTNCCDPITSNLYDAGQAGEVPDAALSASLGCGNPTALAELKPGEIVLDLGSGGGIDVLLSAKRVGPDRQSLRPRHDRRNARARRTEPAQKWPDERRIPERRDRAHPSARQHRGRDHLELRYQPLGRQGPSAQGSVPGLEAWWTLRSLGRGRARGSAGFAFARAWNSGSAAWPVPSPNPITRQARQGRVRAISMSRSRACTAVTTRVTFLAAEGFDGDAIAKEVDGKFISAFIRAVKPESCCAPGCCSR